MKPVTMWAVVDRSGAILVVHPNRSTAEAYVHGRIFRNRYTIQRVTVTVEEKEKGE